MKKCETQPQNIVRWQSLWPRDISKGPRLVKWMCLTIGCTISSLLFISLVKVIAIICMFSSDLDWNPSAQFASMTGCAKKLISRCDLLFGLG